MTGAFNTYDLLKERGFVQQVTNEDAVRRLFSESLTAYVGYDPTAASLHVGNLFSIMALLHLERGGHRPILVLGGGTAMVGDPSGKTEMRQMLTREHIENNRRALERQVHAIFDANVPGGKKNRMVVDNAEWLLDLKYVDFLRDVGKHFSVNRMLTAEAYKARMERGLSFIEFNYQLLQAYDFRELRRRHNCRLQMGGDDQWANILAGVELCRRMDQVEVEGLTCPLLLTATGEKMGKTAAGAVWLDANLVNPYDYYQYWVNVHDADVERLLAYYTFLPMVEVRAVSQLKDAALNQAKAILAFEATCIVHGLEEATKAHQAAQAAFGGRALDLTLLPSSRVPRQAQTAVEDIPTTSIERSLLVTGLNLVDLLTRTNLAESKSAARRLIEQKAVRLGERTIDDAWYNVTVADLNDDVLLLRVGKKKVHRVRCT